MKGFAFAFAALCAAALPLALFAENGALAQGLNGCEIELKSLLPHQNTAQKPVKNSNSALPFQNNSLKDEVFEAPVITPITGTGSLLIRVESFRSFNERCVSSLADRAEIWLGSKRLASLNANEPRVKNIGKHRFFAFNPINLKKGYYFITIRLYSQGALHGRKKWQAITFQVGIHPNQTTKIYKKIPFYNY